MDVVSLARQTDLMFTRFDGEVLDRGDYLVIRTPANPGYHWGNFILFDAPPSESDFKKWCDTFRREFPFYSPLRHMTMTWNEITAEGGVFDSFLKAGFVLDKAKVLTAQAVMKPSKFNSALTVQRLETEAQWEAAIQLQVACRDSKYPEKGYEIFKRRQFQVYRAMAAAGMGSWFGAFLQNQLVGDLGVFYTGDLGRFQNVGTHPQYRRQGICGTLVYHAAQIAFEEFGVTNLLMEADADYHAAAIYESVGFKPTEENRSLSWQQEVEGRKG